MRLRALIWIAVLLGCSAVVQAEAKKTTEVTLDGSRRLVFSHPAAWTVETSVAGPRHLVTFHSAKGSGAGFKVIVVAMEGDETEMSDEDMAEMSRRYPLKYFPDAKPEETKLLPIRGAEARGFLYRTPEAKRKVDDSETAGGIVMAGPHFLTVSIYAGNAPVPQSALDVLAGITHKP